MHRATQKVQSKKKIRKTAGRAPSLREIVCFRRVLPSRVNALGYLRVQRTSMLLCFVCFNSFVLPTLPPHTHRQRNINEDKIVPNTDNFMISVISHFYNFIPVIDTAV
jgi:hypothetical protein